MVPLRGVIGPLKILPHKVTVEIIGGHVGRIRLVGHYEAGPDLFCKGLHVAPGTARDFFEMGNALDNIQPVIEPVAAAIIDHAKGLGHSRNVGEFKFLCHIRGNRGEELCHPKSPAVLRIGPLACAAVGEKARPYRCKSSDRY